MYILYIRKQCNLALEHSSGRYPSAYMYIILDGKSYIFPCLPGPPSWIIMHAYIIIQDGGPHVLPLLLDQYY